MADDNPSKDKTEEDAKPLNPSDMDPDELVKAIEKSVAHEENSKTVEAENKDTNKDSNSTKDKEAENVSKGKGKAEEAKDDKPQEKPDEKKDKPKDNASEDQGIPIIVKRRSYVSPASSSSASTNNEPDKEEKPLEPPSKTSKVVDPKNGSAGTAQTEEQPPEEEKTKETKIPKDNQKSEQSQETAGKTDAGNVKEPELPAQVDKPDKAQTDASPTQPVSAEASAATQNVDGKSDKDGGIHDPTEEKPQKPTVFDTTEYHLPIKARNHKYVNSVVAWVVLALITAIAAGYVLYRLGVIEFGDLKILG